METENIEKVDNYNFSVINGADVRVGHCVRNNNCQILICTGTDCKNYMPKHPSKGK